MLALFGQMEQTYAIERAAHARAVAAAKGKRIGRPSVVDPAKLAYAAHLRDQGGSVPRRDHQSHGYHSLQPLPLPAATTTGNADRRTSRTRDVHVIPQLAAIMSVQVIESESVDLSGVPGIELLEELRLRAVARASMESMESKK